MPPRRIIPPVDESENVQEEIKVVKRKPKKKPASPEQSDDDENAKTQTSVDMGFRSGYSVRRKPKDWHLVNRNGIQEWTQKTFMYQDKEFAQAENELCTLNKHQHIVKDFLQSDGPNRSLLFYHGLGSGKTRAAISVAENLSSDYKIVVMLPASLEGNFVKEITTCANPPYLINQPWKYISETHKRFRVAKQECLQKGVKNATIKKNHGVWIGGEGEEYGKLAPTDQQQIMSQITDMVNKRYTFIHYNGWSLEKVKKMDNFDNCIVIIDEVHNFISQVINNRMAIKVYNALMRSSNMKLVMLSGTPLINKPYEVAAICNLARGYLHSIDIQCKKDSFNKGYHEEARTWLENDPYVDFFNIDIASRKIVIVPLPVGFKWSSNDRKYVVRSNDHSSYDDLYDYFTETLQNEYAIDLLGQKPKTFTVFPMAKENKVHLAQDEFNETYIDFSATRLPNGDPIRNKNKMTRRMQGLISYYESKDLTFFPRVEPHPTIVEFNMSDEMFLNYMNIRQIEFAQEERSFKRRADSEEAQLSPGNNYKAMSRACCNFTFPTEIPRPTTTNKRALEVDIDHNESDDESSSGDDDKDDQEKEGKTSTQDNKKQYAKLLNIAKQSLVKGRDKYFNSDRLKSLSPKFHAILEKVQACPGTCLVYSQFRNFEGHGIFAEVLNYHGFVELKVEKQKVGGAYQWQIRNTEEELRKPKYIVFTDVQEKNNILTNIFNGTYAVLPSSIREVVEKIHPNNHYGEVVKAILITKSGSEGISLRNVREVHIMEPYWNDVRIQQVIGRASRHGSHLDLPEKDRKVDVYMYMMKFDDKQMKDSKVMLREKQKTTDQTIYDIAMRKKAISDTMLQIMRNASIDCLIHKNKHPGVQCSKIPKNFGQPEGVLYPYDSNIIDPDDALLSKKTVTTKVQKHVKSLTIKGTKLYFYESDGDEKELLDSKEYEKTPSNHVVIGMLEFKNGRPKGVKLFENK